MVIDSQLLLWSNSPPRYHYLWALFLLYIVTALISQSADSTLHFPYGFHIWSVVLYVFVYLGPRSLSTDGLLLVAQRPLLAMLKDHMQCQGLKQSHSQSSHKKTNEYYSSGTKHNVFLLYKISTSEIDLDCFSLVIPYLSGRDFW